VVGNLAVLYAALSRIWLGAEKLHSKAQIPLRRLGLSPCFVTDKISLERHTGLSQYRNVQMNY